MISSLRLKLSCSKLLLSSCSFVLTCSCVGQASEQFKLWKQSPSYPSNQYQLAICNIDSALQYLESDSAKLLELARKGLRLAEGVQFKSGSALAHQVLGSYYSHIGRVDEALNSFDKALSLAESGADSLLIAKIKHSTGRVYFDVGAFEDANGVLFQSLQILEQYQDSLQLAECLTSLGSVQLKLFRYEVAEEYFKKAYEIRKKIGDIEGQINSNIGLGNLLIRKGNPDSAHVHFKRAYDIAIKGSNLRMIGSALISLGISMSRRGDDDSAIVLYSAALPYFDSIDYKMGTAKALNNIGDKYYAKSMMDSTIYYNKKSAAISKEIGNREDMKLSYHNLAWAYYEIGDLDGCFDAWFLHDSVGKLLNDEHYKQLYAVAEFKYKVQKIKQEKEAIVQDEKSKNRILTISLGGLGAVSALSFILFLFYRQRQHAKELLSQEMMQSLLKKQEISALNAMVEGQEKERKRVAEDLHDRVGSLLGALKLHMGKLDSSVSDLKERQDEQFTKVNSILEETVTEVRRISHNMMSGVLMKFGLVAALNELAETISSADKVRVKLLTFGLDDRLDSKLEIGVYRIMQEMVNNTLKHARAKEITIRLKQLDNALEVMYKDDGLGFDPAAQVAKPGIGLDNIRERLNILKGAMTNLTEKGKGAYYVLQIPIDAPA